MTGCEGTTHACERMIGCGEMTGGCEGMIGSGTLGMVRCSVMQWPVGKIFIENTICIFSATYQSNQFPAHSMLDLMLDLLLDLRGFPGLDDLFFFFCFIIL
jgi:hypothetical protein